MRGRKLSLYRASPSGLRSNGVLSDASPAKSARICTKTPRRGSVPRLNAGICTQTYRHRRKIEMLFALGGYCHHASATRGRTGQKDEFLLALPPETWGDSPGLRPMNMLRVLPVPNGAPRRTPPPPPRARRTPIREYLTAFSTISAPTDVRRRKGRASAAFRVSLRATTIAPVASTASSNLKRVLVAQIERQTATRVTVDKFRIDLPMDGFPLRWGFDNDQQQTGAVGALGSEAISRLRRQSPATDFPA